MFNISNRYLYILLLATYSFFNILLIDGDRLFVFEINMAYLFLTIFANVILVWEANRLIQVADILRKPFNRLNINHLIINFIYSFICCLLISLISVFIIFEILSHPFQNFYVNFKLAVGFTFRINLFLNCVNAIVFYVNRYSATKVEALRFQKQYAEAKFDALKNQVNPHFLFNSFNVLSTLVYKDQDNAIEFINQMSKVYRYVLKHQDEKLVNLREELDFIDAYIYLLKIRFQEKIDFDIQLSGDLESHFIAPVTLQILLENAIKHNEISKSNPLLIKIYNSIDNNYIIIGNSVKPKSDKYIDSTFVGLKNIKARYQFISNKSIEINFNEREFIVKIPLLQMLEHESINS
ncbi:MAG: hypothetical protein CMO01_13655 [Thalassobius sp.]|nr:hypothetical protein [Thalassovita sp.]